MDALDFLESCTTNLEYDRDKVTLKTPLDRGLTMSGCGWDEGEQSYCLLDAKPLIAEVSRCLELAQDRSRVRVEGIRYYSRYEVDGGVVEGIIPGSETETLVEAELEIDIVGKRTELLTVSEKTA